MLALRIVLFTLGVVFSLPAACLPADTAQNPNTKQMEASQLLLEVRAAAESQIAKYRSDPKFNKFELELAEVQMTRIRVLVDCQDGVASIRARISYNGSSVAQSLDDVRQTADRDCRVALAKLAADRWDDPWLNPPEKMALRYRMGAELSVLGDPNGSSLMKQAEQALTAEQQFNAIVKARFKLFALYVDSKDRERLFEESVPFLKELHVSNSTRNGFLTLFAQFGRCDLVEKVSGPGSCPEFERSAKNLYGPSETNKELARQFEQWADAIGIEQISTYRNGIKQALSSKFPLGYLVLLAMRARAIVAAP